MTEEAHGVDFWAAMFDNVAETYDQSGVAFFASIAGGLVDRLAPRPDDRVLELGSGRGAATVPLATAVGPGGSVTGVDASGRMVELLGQVVRERGLSQVRVVQGDAASPPPGPYDVVCASLVLFFLPDPVAALAAWRSQLAAGARVGVSSFAPWPPSMRAVMEVLEAHRAEDAADTTEMPEAFRSDEGVEALFHEAGFAAVRTERAIFDVVYRDVDQWLSWALGTAVRGSWLQIPDDDKPAALAEIREVLAAHDHRLHTDIRYTLASG
jgi:ubiquinone/menaquinone biosynthesis C-methylase UbiE